jgi:hypothetical protein
MKQKKESDKQLENKNVTIFLNILCHASNFSYSRRFLRNPIRHVWVRIGLEMHETRTESDYTILRRSTESDFIRIHLIKMWERKQLYARSFNANI